MSEKLLPLRYFEGVGDDHAVLVSVPHAGLVVPDEDRAVLALAGRALERDADLHVDKLVQGLPALGVPCVVAQVSRYVVDVNRAPDDVDKDVCPDIERAARPSPRGLAWRLTSDGHAVLRRPLTPREVKSRVDRVHAPYHLLLQELLNAKRRRHGFAILLDVHSMPAWGRTPESSRLVRRADIVPGDVRGVSCAPALSQLVGEHFRGAGYSVVMNEPYMGGYITKHHGRPARGVHALQIEINRDLYMDETTHALKADGAAALATVLTRLTEKVRALRLAT